MRFATDSRTCVKAELAFASSFLLREGVSILASEKPQTENHTILIGKAHLSLNLENLVFDNTKTLF